LVKAIFCYFCTLFNISVHHKQKEKSVRCEIAYMIENNIVFAVMFNR